MINYAEFAHGVAADTGGRYEVGYSHTGVYARLRADGAQWFALIGTGDAPTALVTAP